MNKFIDKCKQYKSWNEFAVFLIEYYYLRTKSKIDARLIKLYEEHEFDSIPFESLIGWFLKFLLEKEDTKHFISGFLSGWFYSTPTSWEETQSALKKIILTAFKMLEKKA